MKKTWVIGDIHGNLMGLQQALQKSKFDYENDTLIAIGDYCDGGLPLVAECIDELLNIKNLIPLLGNHDQWFIDWMKTGIHPDEWRQGGYSTMQSYLNRTDSKIKLIQNHPFGPRSTLNPSDIEPAHETFFKSLRLHYVDDNNRIFVHGGFNRHIALKQNPPYLLYWDRDLWLSALSFKQMPSNSKFKFKMHDQWNHVYIGHTQTTNWDTDQPMHAANITNIDTGGGWKGRITIMNVDDPTEFYQSELTLTNYPDFKGR